MRCIKCGYQNLYSDILVTEDKIYKRWECKYCEFVWYEVYTFSHREDEQDNKINEKGEIE